MLWLELFIFTPHYPNQLYICVDMDIPYTSHTMLVLNAARPLKGVFLKTVPVPERGGMHMQNWLNALIAGS